MQTWNELLRYARRVRAVAQQDVARQARIPVASVKAYEGGRRHPPRHRLTAILDALGVSQRERNEILAAAGFAPDTVARLVDPAQRLMPMSRAVEEIHRHRWPAFVVNERMEIVEANAAGRRLWRMDPADPALAPIERNVLAFATDPVIADHVVNWEEAVSAVMSAWKGQFGDDDPADPQGYFAQIIDRLTTGDPGYLERTLALWEQAQAQYPAEYRWAYPVVWTEPPFGTMRFQGFAWLVNERDGIDIDDWIPTDAESWLVLERVMASEAQARAGTEAMRRRPSSTRSSASVRERRT
jgi:transcriptional regulator with XRE-family HTH domain